MRNQCTLLIATLALTPMAAARPAPPLPGFIRGDANGTDSIDISDAIYALDHLFLGGPRPPCEAAMDSNADSELNIVDPIYLLNFLFLGGPAPRGYPECDFDDLFLLTCEEPSPLCLGDPWSSWDSIQLAYGVIDTIAGKGEVSAAGVNNWLPEFEGGPATAAELSAPHIALGDAAGNIYIADKEAHAIRRIDRDGVITTVAGTNEPGDDGDDPGPATERSLREPNGLWVRDDGVFYILDTDNAKVRKVDRDGTMTTLFAVPGLRTGRGLWVAPDESRAYVSSRDRLLEWTPSDGLRVLADGFIQLGNFIVDGDGSIVATDRDAHLVHRISPDGSGEVIAGNGTTSGGGDGELALATGLDQVRGVWPADSIVGGYLLATQAGSQVWYLDPDGTIHLLIDGSPNGVHAGDGSLYNEPGPKVSQIRSVTADPFGNLLITEHDAGYVRRVEFIGIAIP